MEIFKEEEINCEQNGGGLLLKDRQYTLPLTGRTMKTHSSRSRKKRTNGSKGKTKHPRSGSRKRVVKKRGSKSGGLKRLNQCSSKKKKKRTKKRSQHGQ